MDERTIRCWKEEAEYRLREAAKQAKAYGLEEHSEHEHDGVSIITRLLRDQRNNRSWKDEAEYRLRKAAKRAQAKVYEELEINDLPQNARWKITHSETLIPISERTGAAIIARGQYIPPGRIPGQNERKLYLFIEGPTAQSVKQAKSQLERVLEDISMQATSLPGSV